MADATTSAQRSKVGVGTLMPYLRGHAVALAFVALLSLVAAGGMLAQPLLVRTVLDRLGQGEPVGRYVGMLVVLLTGVAAIQGVRNYLLQRTAEGLVLATRRRLAGHLLRLSIAEYDHRRTGDLLSRIGADTTLLRVVATSGLLELATGTVIVIGAATMMFLLDAVMFAVTAAGLVGMFGAILIARRVRGASEQVQARIGEMTAAVERAISGVRTIRAARAEDRETSTVGAAAYAAYSAGLRVARLVALVYPTVSTAIQGAFLAVLGVGGGRVAAGTMSLGDLVAFVLFLFLLMMPVMQAMSAYTQLQAGLGALQRIEDMLTLPTETSADPPVVIPKAPRGALAVEFDHVSFGYAADEPALHDVTFAVPYQTRTAIVGPSGAGKSTLLALVERFYDTTSGTVRVGGVDVRDQPRIELRAELGYVEQDAPVLAGTIRDNLQLSAPDATEQELRAMLGLVNLTEVTERTAEGLDAQVGEGGVLLSGGERQRLAIARTLLAAPPVLLLDEPTSNLDSRNEQALRQAIHAASEQRTLLIVAHRLSTVVDADQIIVLDHGRVVATGRHHDLADTNPLYRELATHQLLVT